MSLLAPRRLVWLLLVALVAYRLRVARGGALPATLTLRYGGRILHPPRSAREESARSFGETPGTIGREGVYLAGSTAWVPRLGSELVTFSLEVGLPAGWEAVSGEDLSRFFAAWLERPGAPELALSRVVGVAATPAGDGGFALELELAQTQKEEPYPLEVPVEVTVEGEVEARVLTVPLEGRTATVDAVVPARPLRLAVDPDFDLFRRLDPREVPPSLGRVFGAERALVVLPAVQPTTGPHPDYHRPGDDAGKVDVPGLVRLASFAQEIITYLADRDEPLTSTLAGAAAESKPPPAAAGGRRVSLGSVPDFAYEGPGVRLAGVVPGSPAARAGLSEGDVLVRLGDIPVGTLRDLSRALASSAPGDRVEVVYRRGGEERRVEVVLVAR